MSHATSDQLQNLPGFGQVKVKNFKNAFEKPFRNQATTSIAVSLSQQKSAQAGPSGSQATLQRGQAPPGREPSPTWDIEVDEAPLPDDDDDIEDVRLRDKGKARAEVFDINLDLN